VTSPRVDISLILPAYNEERSIAGTLEAARGYFDDRGLAFEIVVAADGDDRTREIAGDVADGDPRIRVIGGPERRGKGRGIRDGVAICHGAVIGFADADGKTPIEELDRFRSRLDQGYDVVIGSRTLPGSRVEVAQPLHRRLGSKGFNLVRDALLGLKDIPDSQCGFKFFRGAVARDLFSRQRVDGYMFDAEVLYLARRSGYRIAQVPIRWRDDADSRVDLLASNARSAVDLVRIRLGGRRRSPEASLATAYDPE
jgi:dolichyl-phosphate beta-glucosyltransferase